MDATSGAAVRPLLLRELLRPGALDTIGDDVAIAVARLGLGQAELLAGTPRWDRAQWPVGAAAPAIEQLPAWLYLATARIAHPVLVVDGPSVDQTDPAQAGDPLIQGWRALLAADLHTPQQSLARAVAMPVQPPFDEPGLRICPLLLVRADLSPDGTAWRGETCVASVRRGQPHVSPVQVISLPGLVRHLAATGQHTVEPVQLPEPGVLADW